MQHPASSHHPQPPAMAVNSGGVATRACGQVPGITAPQAERSMARLSTARAKHAAAYFVVSEILTGRIALTEILFGRVAVQFTETPTGEVKRSPVKPI